MATKNVQLKNGNGDLLMPKTKADNVDNCELIDYAPYFYDGYEILNGGAVGTVVAITAAAASNWTLFYKNCLPGEKFLITAHGGTNAVAYTFLDYSTRKIVETSGNGAKLIDEVITAPVIDGVSQLRLIVQTNKNYAERLSVKGIESLADKVNKDVSLFNKTPLVANSVTYGKRLTVNGSLENDQLYCVALYEINDISVKYYADIVTAISQSSSLTLFSGVAYYDESDVYISSEYNKRYGNPGTGAAVYENAVLSPPPGTKYIRISGYSPDSSVIRHPVLYKGETLPDTLGNYGIDDRFVFLAEVEAVGVGTDTAYTNRLVNVKPYKTYMLKLDPNWEYSESFILASNVLFLQFLDANKIARSVYNGNVYLIQKCREAGVYVFSAPRDTYYLSLRFRGVEDVRVKFSIYELDDTGEALAATRTNADVSPGEIEYHTVKVKIPVYDNSQTTDTEFQFTEIDSAWGVRFPSTYTKNGKPTRVIGMFHGAHGLVDPQNLGYLHSDHQNWYDWQDLYLQNGYAVMDVNGAGVGNDNGEATFWGCPTGLETIHKAFNYLRENYNVYDTMLIQGSSMGGSTAWNYMATYPNDILAAALVSPATTSWALLRENPSLDGLHNWSYADKAAAVADNFQKLVGYDPLLRCDKYDADMQFVPIDNLVGYNVLDYGGDDDNYTLIGRALPCPVRIWHSSQDETVPIELSEIIVKAYRLGGQNITLRQCPVAAGVVAHSICTGNTAYVVNEIIEFMNYYN